MKLSSATAHQTGTFFNSICHAASKCDRFHFQMGRWGGIVGWAVAVA
ncbi:MAG: hypothetical protein F6J98_25325 [Moorea sp. SIO4G2]|nr:hypothetical protein [Moorena sp. SIO4A5]NEO20593.1 hypothetical protein [Moorena sp. SIO4A5]NEO63574.1 hypothetical protein [Moorena sp. SIO4G2]